MSTIAHYELRVIRLEGSQCKSKESDLFVEVRLDDDVQKTQIIKSTSSPTWNKTLTFSTSNTSTTTFFNIRVIQKRKFWFAQCIGHIECTLLKLLAECACGKAKLGLSLMSKNGLSMPAGNIHLYLKDIDAEARGKIDIEEAREQIGQITDSTDDADSVGSKMDIIVHHLDNVVKAVDEVVKIHPYLNLGWQIVSALYKIVSRQFRTDQKLVELVQTMQETFEFARDAKSLSDKTEKVKKGFDDVLRLACECCRFVQEYTRHGVFGRMSKINSNRRILLYKEQFDGLKAALDTGLALNVALKVDSIDVRQQLQILEKVLEPSKSDTSKRARCLPNTRSEYIQKIKDRLFSVTSHNILWLNGIAGSGKSTIAATIMDYCDDNACLAAFIFFERGKDEYSSIIRTIAYQLASFHPTIARHITSAVEQLTNITGSLPARQFEKLLLEPLRAAVGASHTVKGPIIVILDALDECGSIEQRHEILQLLKVEFSSLPLEFRFLVTSRPDNDIMNAFSSKEHIYRIDLDHFSEKTQHDVTAYLDHAFHDIIPEIPDNWQWDANMKVLSDAANGLFIWAATAIRMVRETDDKLGMLEDLLKNIRVVDKFGLDSLYATVLRQSGISWKRPSSKSLFRRVLGLILFSKEALSGEGVANFLGSEVRTVDLILGSLRSVLSYEPGKPIHLHHASFADYITTSSRSGQESWFIDEGSQKKAIVSQCFDVMSKHLRFNICDLESSFLLNDEIKGLDERVKLRVPPHLNYACLFWADHLGEISYSPDTSKLLETFAKTYILYWLEVLSLTRNIKRISSISEATTWIAANDTALSQFLWDAYRTASIFAYPISQSTPHIYLSALSLTKGQSEVSDHYSCIHPVVSVEMYGTKARVPCIKVLKHTNPVGSVAFSPDGKRILSSSWDCSICVWDSYSGEVTLGPLKGHTGSVSSVTFSPDGKRIVSGSQDQSIRVWDAESGEGVWSLSFQGYTSGVDSVTFSPDGKRIVSGSVDCRVRVWDAESGDLVLGPLDGHSWAVSSVAFSPDGMRIASGSDDGLICLWNARSGVRVLPPFGSGSDVRSIAFSPDGKSVVSGTNDRSIRLWDVENGECVLGPLQGHTGDVRSVAFSPDGKHIVSGSNDHTILIWDAESGKIVLGPLKGHTESVTSVTFSPDGKRIASGSNDHTIRIWDAEIGEGVLGPSEGHINRVSSVASTPDGQRIVPSIRHWPENEKDVLGPVEGHTDEVNSVAFSPNGKRIVSGSRDRTIRLWDMESGECVLGPLQGHTDSVNSVAFSPDGKRIVSGSDDHKIRIWDAESGKGICEPFGHRTDVTSVAFSSDNKHVVSGSHYSIRVWNARSGRCVNYVYLLDILLADWVLSVAFSPDGKQIVSGSTDGSIYTCDAKSDHYWRVPPVHDEQVNSVAFSPDGMHIASGSDDHSIIIWDPETCEVVVGPLKGHRGAVNSVAFSPDGKRVVSGSDDRAIRLWDAEIGKTVLGPLRGHTSLVTSVAFSPDGKHVVSGSYDCSIRVWSVEIEKKEKGPGKIENEMVDLASRSVVGSLASSPHTTIQPSGTSKANGTSSSLRRLIGPNWDWSEDGWILGRHDELLIWIPDDWRGTLWNPRNTAVFSCPFSTKLDFAGSPIGENWCKGFPKSS